MHIVFFVIEAALLTTYRIVTAYNLETMSIFFKYLCSLAFFFYGAYCFYKNKNRNEEDKTISVKIMLTLFLAFLADIVIQVKFRTGFIVFILVQLSLFITYLELGKFNWRIFTVSVPVSVVLMLIDIFTPAIQLGSLAVPVFIYMLLVCTTSTTALFGLRGHTTGRTILAVAAVLFAISTYLLHFSVKGIGTLTGSAAFVVTTFNNIFYYLSQMLMAYSLTKDIVKE